MKLNSMANTLKLLLLALSLSTLTACASNEGAKHDDTMSGGALIGVNYTGEGIQRFSVDESGGGRLIGMASAAITAARCTPKYGRQN